MTDDQRSINLEVEVPGTPEEVWRAIATGPGITSWYVPHSVEEREGGAAMASFGAGPEMQIPGRVAAWDPPNRIVFDAGEGVPSLAFEWTVEARDGGTCIVRLVNSGFGSGEPWDDQYDQMHEGWKLFLLNLRLHLTYFPGQHATPILPMAMWSCPKDGTWRALTSALGIPSSPPVGSRIDVTASDAPPLGGVVIEADSWRLALLLDLPAPGTAFLAVEGGAEHVGVSIWSYLYGEHGAAAAARDQPRWQEWLAAHA
jgi:uncharacterized protein YndB with AHSA1/START domain